MCQAAAAQEAVTLQMWISNRELSTSKGSVKPQSRAGIHTCAAIQWRTDCHRLSTFESCVVAKPCTLNFIECQHRTAGVPKGCGRS
jgi:hypothetical protein